MTFTKPTDIDTDETETDTETSGVFRATRRYTLKAIGTTAVAGVAMSGQAAAHPNSQASSESGEATKFVGCGCGRWCRGTAEGSGRGDASGDGYLRSTPPRPDDDESQSNVDDNGDDGSESPGEGDVDIGQPDDAGDGTDNENEDEDSGEDGEEQSDFAPDTDIVIESVFYSEGENDNPAAYIRNSNQELPLDTRDWSFVTDMVREQSDFEGGVIPPGGILTIRPEEGVFLDAANGGLIILFNDEDEAVANAGYPPNPEYSPGEPETSEGTEEPEESEESEQPETPDTQGTPENDESGNGDDGDSDDETEETDGAGPDEDQTNTDVNEDVPDESESDGDAETDDGSANEDEDDATTTPGEIEAAIHEEINAFRTEEGLSELELSEDLTEVARSHSEDMAESNYFSHTTPAGDGPGDRLEAADVEYNGYGENIAYEYDPDFSESSAGDVAESIVDGWVESEGHRNNILGDYEAQGVGVAVDEHEVFATELLTN